MITFITSSFARVTSVKSSIGIITYQVHIRQVSANTNSFFYHLYPHLFIEIYEEMVKVEHSSKGHKNIHQIRGPSLPYQLAIVGFTSWNPLSRPRGTCCSRHCPLVPRCLAQHLRSWRSYFHHCYPGASIYSGKFS